MTYRDPDAAAKIARQEREKKESIGDLIDRLKRLTLADERRENERLWEVSRDLLAACEDAIAILNDNVSSVAQKHAVIVLDAAIKKAKGG